MILALICNPNQTTVHSDQFFGTSWNVVADIWNLIDEHGDSKKKTPVHLLWALVFIKSYGNEQSHCMQVGGGVTLKRFENGLG